MRRCHAGLHWHDRNLNVAKIIQIVLLWPVVERPLARFESKTTIERNAGIGIGYAHGGMIDAGSDLSGCGRPVLP